MSGLVGPFLRAMENTLQFWHLPPIAMSGWRKTFERANYRKGHHLRRYNRSTILASHSTVGQVLTHTTVNAFAADVFGYRMNTGIAVFSRSSSREAWRPNVSDYYTAARWERSSDSSGTRTWVVVPPLGVDSMAIVPPASRTRSCMLVRPRPWRRFAALTSNPFPESLTMRRISPEFSTSCTSIRFAPLCLAALCTASCRTRKRHIEISCDSFGTCWLVKSIFNFWPSPNSLHQLVIARTTPRQSSFDECSSCDKAWRSVDISEASRCNSCARARTSGGRSSCLSRSSSSPIDNKATRWLTSS